MEISKVIIYILSGITPILIAIVGFFLRKLIIQIEDVRRDVNNLALGLNSIQSELNNNSKEVSEIKAYLNNMERDFNRRMDKQFDMVIENRDKVIKIQTTQENCNARNESLKK